MVKASSSNMYESTYGAYGSAESAEAAAAGDDIYSAADLDEVNRLKKAQAGKLAKLKAEQAAKLGQQPTAEQEIYENNDATSSSAAAAAAPADQDDDNFYGSRNQQQEQQPEEVYGNDEIIKQHEQPQQLDEDIYANDDTPKANGSQQETYSSYVPPKAFEEKAPPPVSQAETKKKAAPFVASAAKTEDLTQSKLFQSAKEVCS